MESNTREDGSQIILLKEIILVREEEDNTIEENTFKHNYVLSLLVYHPQLCGNRDGEITEKLFVGFGGVGYNLRSDCQWWTGCKEDRNL